MASQVEIVRLALGHIADAARVNSIDPPDNSIQAQHAATFYPIARDECLEAFDWTFATRRVALAESLVEFEDGEWLKTYLLPSDYIRTIKVCPPGARADFPGVPFKIESDATELDLVLLTNIEQAILHYIYREEETGRYTPSFISALSLLLGSYLAGPILKGRVGMQVKQGLREEFVGVINNAGKHALNEQAELQTNQQYAGHNPLWVSDR